MKSIQSARRPGDTRRHTGFGRSLIFAATAMGLIGCGGTTESTNQVGEKTSLVIPRLPRDTFAISNVSKTFLADGEGFSRKLELGFNAMYFERDDEACPSFYGSFELERAVVLESSGGELSVNQAASDLVQIEHDGPGDHVLEFKGRLRSFNPESCPGVFDADGAVPFTFTHDLKIQSLGSVKLTFPERCPGEQLVVPGGSIYGLSFDVFDEKGQQLYASNVNIQLPVDIEVVAHEGTEMTFDPQVGLGSLLIEGEPQQIEILAQGQRLGQLRLIDVSQVDEWKVRFSMSGGAKLQYEYPDFQTGDILELPLVGALFAANVELFSQGRRICSGGLPAREFETMSTTPEICSLYSLGENNEVLSPIGWFTEFGECSFSFRMPRANGGVGFATDRKFTTVEKPFF